MSKNTTVIGIKPNVTNRSDFYQVYQDVYNRILRKKFVILRVKEIHLSKQIDGEITFADMFYVDLREKGFYKKLKTFSESGITLFLEVELPEEEGLAYQVWRDMIGPTDPLKCEPHHLRYIYGDRSEQTDGFTTPANGFHGSSSQISADYEAELLW